MTRTEYAVKVDWLSRAFKLDKRIQNINKKIDFLKSTALGTCVNINPEIIGGGFDGSKLENKVVSYVDLEKRRNALVADLSIARGEISTAIDIIEDPACYAVMMARYLGYEKWDAIADMLDQSFESRYVFQVHRKGVNCIKLPKETA